MIVDYEDLDECVLNLTPKIKRAARMRQNLVIGLDTDDVMGEMFATLMQVWKWAHNRPEPTEVKPVFWTAWNRRLFRLRKHSRDRYMNSLASGSIVDIHDAFTASMELDDPLIGLAEILSDLDPEASAVARMKAEGFTRDEVMSILGITRREYYKRWNRVVKAVKGAVQCDE